ncbi:MAG TPA: hypothetical protein VHR35_15655 [Nocardioides sp.]|jgi:hypothetical protein|nr:hypothetical protein [Nocardioides sp.]
MTLVGSRHLASLPVSALTVGSWDAWVLLCLRCARRVAVLLIPLGCCVAVLSGLFDDRLASHFATVGAFLNALVSPLWLLAVGILLRLAIAPMAYTAALLVVVAGRVEVVGGSGTTSRWSRFIDAFRVAGGLRALRWTSAVCDEAAARLGVAGRLLRLTEQILGWLVVVAWAAFVVVVALHT